MHEYTEEQTKDFMERAKAFADDYTPMMADLKERHQIEMVYAPVFTPTPAGVFVVNVNEQMGDLKYKSTPSPIADIIAE